MGKKDLKTFYFDTGVKFTTNPFLFRGQVFRNGTKQIPFDCENVPEGSTLLFLSIHDDLREAELEEVIVREVFNSTIASKFAYFRVPKST